MPFIWNVTILSTKPFLCLQNSICLPRCYKKSRFSEPMGVLGSYCFAGIAWCKEWLYLQSQSCREFGHWRNRHQLIDNHLKWLNRCNIFLCYPTIEEYNYAIHIQKKKQRQWHFAGFIVLMQAPMIVGCIELASHGKTMLPNTGTVFCHWEDFVLLYQSLLWV